MNWTFLYYLQGGEHINCNYFKTNEGKWKFHALYFISKPHKTITQSSFQYAILQQQLFAQFVLWNYQLLHAISSIQYFGQSFNQAHFQRLSSCVRWATDLSFKHGPNTEVHWVEIRRWRRPQFLAPKPKDFLYTKLGFYWRCERYNHPVDNGEIFIFEVFFVISSKAGAKISLMCTFVLTLSLSFTKIRDLQLFDTAAQTMTDTGFWRW